MALTKRQKGGIADKPILGEIRKGRDIGKEPNQHQLYIWQACTDCGKARWVRLCKGKPTSLLCHTCGMVKKWNEIKDKVRESICLRNSMENSPSWKGGRIKNAGGYALVKLPQNSPYFPMVNKERYILEHRLIIAQKLGRCLLKSEQVHHLNGIRDDNRPENLQLISPTNHTIKGKLCYNCSLRKEIRLLQFQNKLLLEQTREMNLHMMGYLVKGNKNGEE